MCEWLEEESIQKAKMLCVVDKKLDRKAVMVGLRNKVPLLIPEENEELKRLCTAGNCGLCYGPDPIDLEACMHYLSNNEAARKAMGRNGLRIFYSNAC